MTNDRQTHEPATMCPDSQNLEPLGAVDHDYVMFASATVGSDWLRRSAFARRRIDRIADLIGNDTAEAIVSEIKSQFGTTVDPRMWAAYQQHDTAARDALLFAAMRDVEKRNRQVEDEHDELLAQAWDEESERCCASCGEAPADCVCNGSRGRT